MQVTVFTDCRFARHADGVVCSLDDVNAYPRWRRFLPVFDRVVVVGRVLDVGGVATTPVTGPGVDFHGVPHYHGLAAYLRTARRIGSTIDEVCTWPGAFMLRTPGNISRLAWPRLMRRRRAYGVEVAGDPYDIFAPGAIGHPLRPFLRRLGVSMQQKHVLHAAVAQYVTEQYLQRRYPTRGHAAAVANVDLPVEAFASGPRAAPAGAERTIAFVGTFDVMYKAPDVLLRAMQRCVATGLDLRLEFVGEGRHRQAMQALAADLGIADRVEFHGRVRAGKDVRDILDRVDLFVHPSRTEGLPRALLEAMARALPCVATRVGGIPELIEDRYLVSPGEVEELSRKLLEVLSDPARMAAASARNLERSRDYSTVSLSQKREAAYRELLRRSAGGQR